MKYLDHLQSRQDESLPEYKIAILRNFTVEPLLPALSSELGKLGLRATFYLGDYDSVAEGMFVGFHNFDPDCALVMQWGDRNVPITEDMMASLRKWTKAPVVVNNQPKSPYPSTGILESQAGNAPLGKAPGSYLVDFGKLALKLGWDNAVDQKHWGMSRMPFTPSMWSEVAREYAKYVRVLTGKSKKCLVVDCDNALWSGIVGEDQRISPYVEFQKSILALHDRGVLLAICSKNNEGDVWEAFSDSEMVLKKDHFVTWRINWEDKASNIESIAAELNIGLDSLVFVDDSEFECNLVISELPEVEVIQFSIPEYTFADRFADCGLFESLSISDEDGRKTELYRSDIERKSLQASCDNLQEYLRSLEMKATIGRAQRADIPRLAQIAAKTNQFNLDTYRYTESEIEGLLSNAEVSNVFCVSVKDKISDIGTVGMVVVWYHDDYYFIRSFMLSCRALGRGIEDALLAFLMRDAKRRGYKTVRGRFSPSKKNSQVSDFYQKHGFSDMGQGTWNIVIDGYPDYPGWIEVEDRYA